MDSTNPPPIHPPADHPGEFDQQARNELVEEILRLRAELRKQEDEAQAAANRRARFGLFTSRVGLRAFAGSKLYRTCVGAWDAWSTWLRSGSNEPWPEPQTRDFAAALLARFTRMGAVFLIAAFLPLIITLVQSMILVRQNELIVRQTELAESARRSSLVFEQSSILDEIDEELDASPVPNQRNDSAGLSLSPRLEGRIIALSKSLRPYRYLDGDQLIPRPQSPERGQLLLALVNSGIDLVSIMTHADFGFADLPGARIDGFHFAEVEDPFEMTTVALRGANFRDSGLTNGSFRGADLMDAVFEDAEITDVKFTGALLDSANFRNARLRSVDFTGARLSSADFRGAKIELATFSRSHLGDVSFEGAIIESVDFRGVPSLVTSRLVRRLFAEELCRATAIRYSAIPPAVVTEMENVDGCVNLVKAPQ